jgi:pimeloyl-ACP methyl ester carboxylesterase
VAQGLARHSWEFYFRWIPRHGYFEVRLVRARATRKNSLKTSSLEEQTANVRDGRAIGYGEWGSPDGVPVFFFHGTPGSRILTRVFHEPAEAQGIRLIGTDRPGYGLSDPKEDRTLSDFVSDIEDLAEFLGIDRFGVMGASGGSPYTLACAHEFPNRVLGAVVLCGIGPPECWDEPTRTMLEQASANPAATETQLQQALAMVNESRQTFIDSIIQNSPESMRSVAESKPELVNAYIDHTIEALRQGPGGTLVEQHLVLKPWEFDLADIRVPVRLWCGGKDVLLPQAHWMADRIPGAHLRVDEEAGHIDGLWIGPDLIEMMLLCFADAGAGSGRSK